MSSSYIISIFIFMWIIIKFVFTKRSGYWAIQRNKTGLSRAGLNTIPKIYVDLIEPGGVLVIKHEHEGRDLELSYADEVCQHVMTLWGDVVKLITIVEGEPWEI